MTNIQNVDILKYIIFWRIDFRDQKKHKNLYKNFD